MASFDVIAPFTLKAEGGLSKDSKDNASAYPSPYYFQGSKGWHTNKGITYKTFEAASKLLNIPDNYQNFIVMPQNIWAKIAKFLFWDKLHLSDLKNQSIANLMFSWFWGSGYGWRNRIKAYLKQNNIDWDKNDFKGLIRHLNKLIDKKGAKNVYNAIEETYITFLKSLNQSKFINGWLNRLKELKEYSSGFITANYGKLTTGLIFIGVGYLIYKK